MFGNKLVDFQHHTFTDKKEYEKTEKQRKKLDSVYGGEIYHNIKSFQLRLILSIYCLDRNVSGLFCQWTSSVAECLFVFHIKLKPV